MKGERADTAGLYPPIEPFRSGWLAVGSGHKLYWEEVGNPEGPAVLFLHGGPGAGIAPVHRRFFDPKHWRIVLFDQRGAGRSLPAASITDNTTDHLIADIEALRAHLNIEHWLAFGGSWGSTLALAYGQAHPERVTGYILRGVFLFRRWEVQWFLQGMGTFFPEAERAFREFLPADERTEPLPAYYHRLIDNDPAVHLPAAQAWCAYEEACSRLIPDPAEPRPAPSALAMARIEAHYMVKRGFVQEGQLLRNVRRIRHAPVVIVQGRYDMVCPIRSADELHRAWPGSELIVVPDAGHAALESGVRAALVAASDKMKKLGR